MTRLWRSRAVALTAFLLVFALVAAACSPSDSDAEETTTTTSTTEATTTTTTAPQTTTTEAKPQKPYGGEAIVADDEEPPTLNPYAPGGSKTIVSLIGQGYLTGVQDVDGYTLELVPEVVTELPTTANGGVEVNDEDGTMTVVYTIKDEAVWADGTPISGADFKFTYDVIMDPTLPIGKSTYEDIIPESIEVGPKTFEYTLAAPTAFYELIFGTIIPKHSVEGSDFIADWDQTMWVSGGPFMFDQWVKGESVTLVRNDNYWKTDPVTDQQLPYLDSVTFQFIPDPGAIIDSFKSREVDITQLGGNFTHDQK
ncbi:MAG: ABC transporter substrate-binding protein, partial [Acidimicrobiia bacterium]